jgi:hypothetical protein
MRFDADAFISYAHLDNVELVEGRKGWVANLYRALDVRLAQLIGSDARVWWDPKLQGNDAFEDTLIERLGRVAALVAVVSPRYVRSEWTRRELSAFCDAAHHQCGVRVMDKTRIFKVLKTPVPLDEHPQELQTVLGYEFFKIDSDTGKVRELDEVFGQDAQREFWLKLDDLAHDICSILDLLKDAGGSEAPEPVSNGTAVYLSIATSDLREQREAIRRDLEQHGYLVLPDGPLPLAAGEVADAIRANLARSTMSIHMIGKTYSFVPEGCRASIAEMQYELAVERARGGRFSRLVWIPPNIQVDDDRQQKVLQSLRTDPRMQEGADLLETSLEDLRTMISAWLTRGNTAASQSLSASGSDVSAPQQVYLIYDQRDAGAVAPWADYLFEKFEVLHPVFEGDEAEIREYHEENLRTCAGALIFYGSANEIWLRRKLRELQKIAGYGRALPRPVVGICLVPPKTSDKERFRTHEAMLLAQWDGLSAERLQPFVEQLKRLGGASAGDAVKAPA